MNPDPASKTQLDEFLGLFDGPGSKHQMELRMAMAKLGYTWTGLADIGITLHGADGQTPYGVGRIPPGRYDGKVPQTNPETVQWFPTLEAALGHLQQVV